MQDFHFFTKKRLRNNEFATDTTGAVIWDGGITTPFGESLTLASAFTQNLMFPGQYTDAETGLSHNWHRTYDPTLGRYLQSDPIGLAGGLNRYAYVGGNPVSYVDPTGEFIPLIVVGIILRRAAIGAVIGGVIDIGTQLATNGFKARCIKWKQVGVSASLGALGGGGGAFRSAFKRAGNEWSHSISKKMLTNYLKKAEGLNGQWVSPKRHASHDFWRRLKGEVVANKPHKAIRGLDRIPDFLKGGVGVPSLAELIPSSKKCGC